MGEALQSVGARGSEVILGIPPKLIINSNKEGSSLEALNLNKKADRAAEEQVHYVDLSCKRGGKKAKANKEPKPSTSKQSKSLLEILGVFLTLAAAPASTTVVIAFSSSVDASPGFHTSDIASVDSILACADLVQKSHPSATRGVIGNCS
jgi:hypothetical protein